METLKPAVKVTAEQWHDKSRRGQVAIIDNRPYIVLTHESTSAPVYQPVVIVDTETQR